MPSMFQQALSMARSSGGRITARSPLPPEDDEVALGWECAIPALEFEGWEPDAPVPLSTGLLSSKS